MTENDPSGLKRFIRARTNASPLNGEAMEETKGTHRDAVRYFHVSKRQKSFWGWDEDSRGIAWADGSRIAARAELVLILRRLEGRGLPFFGAIVLLIAACRGKRLSITWHRPTEDEIKNLRVPYVAESGGFQVGGHDRVRMFAEPDAISLTLERLNSFAGTLGDLLETAEGISDLISILLKDPVRGQARDLAGRLESGELTDLELNEPLGGRAKYTDLIPDLALLSQTVNQISLETLRVRLCELHNQRLSAARIELGSPHASLPGVARTVVAIGQFNLPASVDWLCVRSCELGLCAAGWASGEFEHRLVLVRSSWNGSIQMIDWSLPHRSASILLELLRDGRALVHAPNEPSLPAQGTASY